MLLARNKCVGFILQDMFSLCTFVYLETPIMRRKTMLRKVGEDKAIRPAFDISYFSAFCKILTFRTFSGHKLAFCELVATRRGGP